LLRSPTLSAAGSKEGCFWNLRAPSLFTDKMGGYLFYSPLCAKGGERADKRLSDVGVSPLLTAALSSVPKIKHPHLINSKYFKN
jgi:hypothetical protein